MVDEDLMLHEGNRTNLQGKHPALRWILLGTMAPALLWADIAVSAAQGLPPGGGPVPPVWRGADGQIEIVPPNAAARPEIGTARLLQPSRPRPARRGSVGPAWLLQFGVLGRHSP
jgi:hypothetical protein